MPDFAGVALVDILANGVAMLIIVIVVSIAARVERDERHAEQADEVAAVMAHKFSTSLVLNSLAASPPAVLHDYDNSPLDQVLDPQTLPILELHPRFVREYYSGAIWQRRELLRGDNRMHQWLDRLDDGQRQRLRVDVYGVAQFYLAMSILRAHGIVVRHWHFLPRPLSLAAARHCPPGTAAKDCIGESELATALPSLDGGGESDDLGQPESLLAGDGAGDGAGAGGGPGRMPGGVVPGAAGDAGAFGDANASGASGDGQGLGETGGGQGGQNGQGGQGAESAANLGSFPSADPGGQLGGASGGGASGGGQSRSGDGRGAQFRIALPESIRRAAGAGDEGVPPLDAMFAAMLHYLGELQDTLDAGGSPSAQIATFSQRLLAAFRNPPQLNPDERAIARELAVHFALRGLTASADAAPGALAVNPTDAADAESEDAVVVIAPNRINQAVGLIPNSATKSDDATEAASARVQISLNAYPGIWKGLDVRIEPGSVLLMPPLSSQSRRTQAMRWRAAAYISPQLDDVIVGFVFADYDARGNLRAQADANRLRVDGRAVFSRYAEAAFGARGWLVSLYAALAVGLLLLALARGWLGGAARRM